MSYEIEFRLSVGAQYEYVNVRVSAVDSADLARQLDALDDGDGLTIGHMQAALSGVVRHGYNNPGSSPIEKTPPPVAITGVPEDRAHVTPTLSAADKAGITAMLTDHRTPQQLVEQELGGKVVAVQEQAVETPRKAWEVTLPTAPKAWEGVAAEAVKAQAAVEYPAGPPVESPKEKFPF